ncbi:hypothetical protein [Chryseobacterium sp. JUb7]|uniref:hypothetical protein n=1 Tax=Chryseobacterium sp. JUb7 TaxID=2940599 RepID=UPI00216927D0|nr:hypothetical protein [Chryseobacterium sp. JUb7]MCS3531468.1 hypothetical protein [Chryseobacterium sp. JUb7]
MKKVLLLLMFFPLMILSQNLQADELLWSKDRKLKKEDYKLITHDMNVEIKSFISFSYHLRGFNVFNNNLNKNIINKFSGNASVLNPDANNIAALVDYQQVNFDLSEVYARRMRRELLINKSKLWKGFDYAEQTFSTLVSEYQKAQNLMNEETNYGFDFEKLNGWKQKIDNELKDLSEFDYNNTVKIKIKKTEG